MATVSIEGLRKSYGKKTALRGIDLEIADGEFFVLQGPSGAGKTTTLKCLGGLEPLDGGAVRIGGRDMAGVEPYDRNVAMAFESYALYPQHTVFENLVSPLRSPRHRTAPGVAERKVREVASTLGIEPLLDRMPRELSNGQRQRVALGRALTRPADVLLLDEPLSHLDAKLRAQMRAELKSFGALESTTSVYVTHDYAEAVALGDRIGVLRDGELVQVGTRDELWRRPANTVVAKTIGQPAISLLRGVVGGGRFRTADGLLDVPVPEVPISPGTEAVLGIRPRDVRLGASEQYGYVPVSGTVYVTERLGRSREVTVSIGDQYLVALGKDGEWAGFRAGDEITVEIPVAAPLLFSADEDGRLLTGGVR